MFWKIYAVLSLVIASFLGANYIIHSPSSKAIEKEYWTEKSLRTNNYRNCANVGEEGVRCTRWKRALRD